MLFSVVATPVEQNPDFLVRSAWTLLRLSPGGPVGPAVRSAGQRSGVAGRSRPVLGSAAKVRTAAAGARTEPEFFTRLAQAGVLVRTGTARSAQVR